MSKQNKKSYFIDSQGVKHQLKIERRSVIDLRNGYRCLCGEGVVAQSLPDAKKIHSFNIGYDKKDFMSKPEQHGDTWEKSLRQICTYYSELGEGTAGYSLSEKQFAQVEALISSEIAKAEQRVRGDIERWARKNNQCADLVSTADLLEYLENLKQGI